MIGIVDYGAGNLKSVSKAFDYLGYESRLLTGADGFAGVDRLVLPGVGAFGEAARQLKARGLAEPLDGWIKADKPFLGICLGLQLLLESSEESPGEPGIGVFAGTCRRLRERKVPQIGWNTVTARVESDILWDIPPGTYFYFVHSYKVAPEDANLVLAETDYGGPYPSIAGHGRAWGVQFHPEKSGALGLRLLSNWVLKC